jgi:hypothetical protein
MSGKPFVGKPVTKEFRAFLDRVLDEANEKDYNVFAVVEHGGMGHSITRVKGSPGGAVRHARKSHSEWEKPRGIDPNHDWRKDAAVSPFIEGFLSELKKEALILPFIGLERAKKVIMKGTKVPLEGHAWVEPFRIQANVERSPQALRVREFPNTKSRPAGQPWQATSTVRAVR